MLNERSLKKLEGVNPKLVKVVHKAAEKVEFIVTEGLRTKERQRELVAKGASQTMNSRHLTGRAVDVAPLIGGEVRWDWPAFYPIAVAMKEAAKTLNIVVIWGGDWKSFKDGPHFELGVTE